MARNKMAKKTVDESAGTVTYEFSDGRTQTVKLTDLTPAIINRAALHGISQKGGDSYAGAETLDEAHDALESTIKSLTAGTWTTRTPGEGGGKVAMLVEALYRVAKHEGRTMEECEQLVADASDDQKKGMRAVPAIKAALDEIAAERALEKAQKSKAAAANAPLDLSALMSQ